MRTGNASSSDTQRQQAVLVWSFSFIWRNVANRFREKSLLFFLMCVIWAAALGRSLARKTFGKRICGMSSRFPSFLVSWCRRSSEKRHIVIVLHFFFFDSRIRKTCERRCMGGSMHQSGDFVNGGWRMRRWLCFTMCDQNSKDGCDAKWRRWWWILVVFVRLKMFLVFVPDFHFRFELVIAGWLFL